ncbi:MAG: hypothetical protein ACI8RD_007491 [Bacillariaceae sp.]|jgi:hypothetical protein
MSATSGTQLLRRWVLSQSIPYLKQGSTIAIRSRLRTDLRIRSHWRDDGKLSLAQRIIVAPQCSDGSGGNNDGDADISGSFAHILLSRNEDKITSLGRADPHVSIEILDKNEELTLGGDESDSNHPAPKLLSSLPLDNQEEEEEEVAWGDYDDDEEMCCLTLDVPDKINIECDLTQGGSIFIESKIEGDVRLKTAHGNISVSKLRGHNIELETGSTEMTEEQDATPSFIFVSETLECQSLRLSVHRPSIDKIRAKRIHAKTMEIQVGGYGTNETSPSAQASASNITATNEKLDDDDAGAICDISSLYIIGDANVNIQQPAFVNGQHHRQRQALRIKSHHGHLHVEATAPKPNDTNEITGDILPIVDLGGVNGSCEVWVSQPNTYNSAIEDPTVVTDDDWTSCHIHFDSIAPDSVNPIHADGGDIHVTVDRKVEADVRLFSPPSTTNSNDNDKSLQVDMETLLLEDNDDGSLADEVSHMLQNIEGIATSVSGTIIPNSNRIKILTNAFTAREQINMEGLQYCEFVDGWIENTSLEPDSRFDRKHRGDANIDGGIGGGKIRLEGAHSQALYGFDTTSNSNSTEMASKSTFARPLLAVSSPGKIILETLSWLGNIARRYGLDDTRNEEDLGRQATRRKRLGENLTNE